MFLREIGCDCRSTSFQVPPGLTFVGVLDFNEIRFLNIEAQINFAEDEGIIQVEEFGMHYGVEGKVLYGMKMNAIQVRERFETLVFPYILASSCVSRLGLID